jgi:hypothetical protein
VVSLVGDFHLVVEHEWDARLLALEFWTNDRFVLRYAFIQDATRTPNGMSNTARLTRLASYERARLLLPPEEAPPEPPPATASRFPRELAWTVRDNISTTYSWMMTRIGGGPSPDVQTVERTFAPNPPPSVDTLTLAVADVNGEEIATLPVNIR